MRILAFVPNKLTLLLIIGILIGHYFPFDLNWAFALLLLFFSVLVMLFIKKDHQRKIPFGFASLLTTVFLGIFISIHNQPNQHESHYSNKAFSGIMPWELKITEVLKPTGFSNRYIANVMQVNGISCTGRILFNTTLDSSSAVLKVDDELITFSKTELIAPPLNPHQFDYRAFMEKQGVYHQIRSETNSYVILDSPSKTIIGYAANARNHIISQLEQKNFGKNELGVIQALLLGERSNITEQTYSDYKNAGAVHILAVSGLHIGILLLLIQFLLRPLNYLPKGKMIVLILSVVILWGYAFLAGLSPSVIRACTMFSFVAYGLFLNRPSNHFNILALSMFFVLLFINPYLLFHVGFQMSYAAVFSIVWIYPKFQKLWTPKRIIVRYFWQLLTVSISAQLGVLPISIFYFHQFPGLFFISNLIIIPFLGLILATGILAILLAMTHLIPDWLVTYYNSLIYYMNSLVGWVSEQERFLLKSISFDGIQLLLIYLVLITAILITYRSSFKRAIFLLTCLLCFQTWTIIQEIKADKKVELLIPHQTKNTIVINRYGNTMDVLAMDLNKAQFILDNYKIGERINNIKQDSLANSYHYKNKQLLIIDSLGLYNNEEKDKTILLTGSPKINLERLIATTAPKKIIADGSNYKSYTDRWKKTCLKNKIPFHYTGEKGAYYFKNTN
ncbi:ComEC/Rec2 family competence protein [Maribacter sp. CXY002]|uniref:ComEC/Rec2 family competence protein n=1 Tax=Maribacter luteocoastalis TaxID=3407671 RepID=UPI003B6840AE